MRAEVVSIGTELLLGQIVDTNAARLGQVFAEHGADHLFRQTVGDNLARASGAIRLALSRADLVVTIGGLGPTQDDLTREAIAGALDDTLVHDPEVEAHIRSIFESRGLRWVDLNARQAMRPSCGQPIPNPNGTAPGLLCRTDGRVVVALPGPPGEFHPMVDAALRPVLHELGDGTILHSRVLRVIGMGESLIEHKLGDLMASANPTLAPYAKTGEVHLRLTARARSISEASDQIAPLEQEVRARLGAAVYALDETPLETAVLELLESRSHTLGVAESLTGGELASRLTSTPGASRVFVGGFVVYTEAQKHALLGVPTSMLSEHTAVSEPVAAAMALGARDKLGCDWAISLTGYAGPDGGDEANPVGTVYIGLAGPQGVRVARHRFLGQRSGVRTRSVQTALSMVREALLEPEPLG